MLLKYKKHMALRSLDELMGHRFHIPSYQRGYRWTEVEVKALLDDLWEFHRQEPSKNEFYCLQPIVLWRNPEKETMELLDGQQRLTTLYLILSYLEDKRKEENYNSEELFVLDFETRPGSERYLREGRFREENTEASSNIDYYYLSKAYQCIKRWFTESPAHRGAPTKLLQRLLDKSGESANVRVIEYELRDDSKPIEVFLRLNQGKIPLTDAELVKALLLQEDKYNNSESLEEVQSRLKRIAVEWYEVERALAQADRWAFVVPKGREGDTRIDLLLELVAKELELDGGVSAQHILDRKPYYKHPCYVIFAMWLDKEIAKGRTRIEAINDLWEKIMDLHQRIDEWYTSHTLYHYIGYLTSVGVELSWVIELARRMGGMDFEGELRREIGEKIKTIKLGELSYDKSRGDIQKILLLHNVHLAIQARFEQGRFPFSEYKTGPKGSSWSLEHIRPQDPTSPTKIKGCLEWIEEHILSLESRGLVDKVKELRDFKEKIENCNSEDNLSEASQSKFDELFQGVHALDGRIEASGLHGLSNLCLLDKDLNSSLSNSSFDVKRDKIRRYSQERYIPLATRQVFLKGFSAYPESYSIWSGTDAKDYLASIQSTYTFFTKAESHGTDRAND